MLTFKPYVRLSLCFLFLSLAIAVRIEYLYIHTHTNFPLSSISDRYTLIYKIRFCVTSNLYTSTAIRSLRFKGSGNEVYLKRCNFRESHSYNPVSFINLWDKSITHAVCCHYVLKRTSYPCYYICSVLCSAFFFLMSFTIICK